MSCKISISILEILKYWDSCWKLIIVAIIILLYSLIWFIFEVLTEVKGPSLFGSPAQDYIILTCTWIFWIFTFGRKFSRIFWTTGYFLMYVPLQQKLVLLIFFLINITISADIYLYFISFLFAYIHCLLR